MDHETVSHKLEIRNLRLSDYENVRDIMRDAYAGMGGAWREQEFRTILFLFPEGQICVEDKGRVVAAALTLIIDYASLEVDHTYEDIVSNGSFNGHDPKGDYLYGIDLFVHQDYRSMRLGRRLYDARKELCEKLNLKGIIIGGRIPGYGKYHKEMTPVEYIEKVRSRRSSIPC